MKKLYGFTKAISFILITITLSGCGQEEVNIEDLDYRMGQGVFLDRKPFNGIAVEYRSDGAKKSQSEIKDGFVDGWNTKFYRNGQPSRKKQVTYNHRKDEPEEIGESWDYYENGKEASFSYTNENDERHGVWKKWNEEGRLLSEKEFNNGNSVGKHKRWNSDGLLVSTEHYDADGQKHGEFIEACDNEQVKFHGEYEHGKQTGAHQYWFCDGQQEKSQEYSNGKPVGKYEQYANDGKLIAQRNYLNDGSG